jgi:hypothetical protein
MCPWRGLEAIRYRQSLLAVARIAGLSRLGKQHADHVTQDRWKNRLEARSKPALDSIWQHAYGSYVLNFAFRGVSR